MGGGGGDAAFPALGWRGGLRIGVSEFPLQVDAVRCGALVAMVVVASWLRLRLWQHLLPAPLPLPAHPAVSLGVFPFLQTTIEVRNMSMPGELQRRLAPAPAPPEVCAVTGQPARYRDPATGLPYATLEAFKELRRRRDADLLGGSSMGGMDGTLQQQAAAAPGSGTRYSTRHAAAAAPSPLQYMPLQQQLYQPELLLAQAGQPAGHAGAAAPGSVMDGQQAAGATFGGVT